MFSTLFTIFIALNVISSIIILAACVVSGSVSRRMEAVEVLASSYDLRDQVEYATPTAVPHARISQLQRELA